MHRFYIPVDCVKEDIIHIQGREFHHLIDVLRAKEGSKVSAFDERGVEYYGTVVKVRSKEALVRIEVKRKMEEKNGIKITLAQSIPKKNKMDIIVEKTTEIGVDTIIPMMTDRTVVDMEKERTGLKIARWNRIAIEASKQCGRVRPPKVLGVQRFKEVIDSVNDYGLAIFPTLYGERDGLKSTIKDCRSDSIITFIGPEGDFTEEEVRCAKEAGCKTVFLGDNILKVDTAAIAVLSILKYELG